jgi:hypothetical protein
MKRAITDAPTESGAEGRPGMEGDEWAFIFAPVWGRWFS